MIIVVTDTGMMMHRTIEIPESITAEELQLIGKAFTRVLTGKKLQEINRSELQAVRDHLNYRRQIIDSALDAIDFMMNESRDESVIINGALNILNEPEFKDLDKLRRILTILEKDLLLKSVIPEKTSSDIEITIGKENKAQDMQEMSIVIAGFNNFGEMGKIGVIGPVRMEYWKAAGTVESLKDILEKILFKGL